MKLQFTGVGADKKKVVVLSLLGLVLAYVFYSNVLAGPDDVPAPNPRAPLRAGTPSAGAGAIPAPETAPRPPLRRRDETVRRFDFKMSPRDKRPDPTTIDPTLRLDLLAKVQGVTLEGGNRNLFQFAAAPLPPTPEPKIVPASPAAQAAIAADQPAAEPAKPPPPPIPLKFYGYASPVKENVRRAFFLDGDDIIVAGEGQMIKNRYKVLRISINSVLVEDTQFQNQQTLPLEEAAG